MQEFIKKQELQLLVSIFKRNLSSIRIISTASALSDGHQGRLFEFATFERRFEECISQSAVQTKFAQHAVNGKDMVIKLHDLISAVRKSTISCFESKQQHRIDLASQLDYVEKQLELLTSDVRIKIDEVVLDIEKKVASAFTDEIRRLSSLVDQFSRPFHPDNEILLVYKQVIFVTSTLIK